MALLRYEVNTLRAENERLKKEVAGYKAGATCRAARESAEFSMFNNTPFDAGDNDSSDQDGPSYAEHSPATMKRKQRGHRVMSATRAWQSVDRAL